RRVLFRSPRRDPADLPAPRGAAGGRGRGGVALRGRPPARLDHRRAGPRPVLGHRPVGAPPPRRGAAARPADPAGAARRGRPGVTGFAQPCCTARTAPSDAWTRTNPRPSTARSEERRV